MSGWSQFKQDYQGKKVLVMGLGLHGGGVAVAKLFSKIGCKVTVTDLKDSHLLKNSITKLKGHDIRLVLGRHETKDLTSHDVIIRNPSVPKKL